MASLFTFLWFLPPALFFLAALYIKLESLSKKHHKSAQQVKDFLSQGAFLLAVGILTLLANNYLLVPNADTLPSALPFFCYQIILYPVVLTVLSIAIGPSKEIKILKAPHPSERKR